MKHLIGKQIMDFKLGRSGDAFDVSNQLSSMYWRSIVPIMEEIFEELGSEGELIRIDRLEIDLGNLTEEEFRKGRFLDLLKQLLKQELSKLIQQENTNVKKMQMAFGQFEQWLFFLEKGFLPWNFSTSEKDWRKKILDSLGTNMMAVEQLRRLLGHSRIALERLVLQYPPTFLKTIVELYTGKSQNLLLDGSDELRDLSTSSAGIKPAIGRVSWSQRNIELFYWQKLIAEVIGSRAKPAPEVLLGGFLKNYYDLPVLTRFLGDNRSEKYPTIIKALELLAGADPLEDKFGIDTKSRIKDKDLTISEGLLERNIDFSGEEKESLRKEVQEKQETGKASNSVEASSGEDESIEMASRQGHLDEIKTIDENLEENHEPPGRSSLDSKEIRESDVSQISNENDVNKNESISGDSSESPSGAQLKKPGKTTEQEERSIDKSPLVDKSLQTAADKADDFIQKPPVSNEDGDLDQTDLPESKNKKSEEGKTSSEIQQSTGEELAGSGREELANLPKEEANADEARLFEADDVIEEKERITPDELPTKAGAQEESNKESYQREEKPEKKQEEGALEQVDFYKESEEEGDTAPEKRETPPEKNEDEAKGREEQQKQNLHNKELSQPEEKNEKGDTSIQKEEKPSTASLSEEQDPQQDILQSSVEHGDLAELETEETNTTGATGKEKGGQREKKMAFTQEDVFQDKDGENFLPSYLRDDTPPPYSRVGKNEDIYLINAGVILVHPFLVRYFGNLGLLDRRSFKNEKARHRAVRLLHYLVTGLNGMPEYEMVLPKVLCGMPLNVPIDRKLRLSKKQKKEGDAMLEALIEHWGVLGNTSVDGLREGFLQREGKLNFNSGAWNLTIERQTLDILLDKLPWGISVIKLPWMLDMLKVEWR